MPQILLSYKLLGVSISSNGEWHESCTWIAGAFALAGLWVDFQVGFPNPMTCPSTWRPQTCLCKLPGGNLLWSGVLRSCKIAQRQDVKGSVHRTCPWLQKSAPKVGQLLFLWQQGPHLCMHFLRQMLCSLSALLLYLISDLQSPISAKAHKATLEFSDHANDTFVVFSCVIWKRSLLQTFLVLSAQSRDEAAQICQNPKLSMVARC